MIYMRSQYSYKLNTNNQTNSKSIPAYLGLAWAKLSNVLIDKPES